MNMKRFFSATSREAMKQVRAELGDEAVILSNREVDGGVEVIASASDDIAALIDRTPSSPKAPKFAARPVTKVVPKASAKELAAMPTLARVAHASQRAPTPAARSDMRDFRSAAPVAPAPESFAHYIQRSEENRAAQYLELAQQQAPAAASRVSRPAPIASAPAAAPVPPATAAVSRVAAQAPAPAPAPAAVPVVVVAAAAVAPVAAARAAVATHAIAPVAARVQTETDPRLINEIMQMKSLLQEQMGVLAWHDTTSRRPLQAKQVMQMLSAGFSPALARAVSEKLPADFNELQAAAWLQDSLIRNLAVAGEENDMVDRGGIYALVGPTGVGKTTTAAKLAAKCVVKYGTKSLGLITIDSYRIGAEDQLRAYGKILGIMVHTARDAQSLAELIAQMRDKHLVLIDTVGMGQRDARLNDLMQMLNSPAIERVLFLNASAQAETLEDVVRQYSGDVVQTRLQGQTRAQGKGFRRPRKVIVSKLDEAVKYGFFLDCLIRHKLEMQYVTNGQRVPEDLHPANPQYLVHRALKHRGAAEFNLQEIDIPLVFAAANTTTAPTARHV